MSAGPVSTPSAKVPSAQRLPYGPALPSLGGGAISAVTRGAFCRQAGRFLQPNSTQSAEPNESPPLPASPSFFNCCRWTVFSFPSRPLPRLSPLSPKVPSPSPYLSALTFLVVFLPPSTREPPVLLYYPDPPPPYEFYELAPESLWFRQTQIFGQHPAGPNRRNSPTPPPAAAPQIPHPFPQPCQPHRVHRLHLVAAERPDESTRPRSEAAQLHGRLPPGPPPPVGRQSPLTQQGPTRTPPTQMVGGPPPIHTGAPIAGYPPQVPMGGPPPPVPGGPPGSAGAAATAAAAPACRPRTAGLRPRSRVTAGVKHSSLSASTLSVAHFPQRAPRTRMFMTATHADPSPPRGTTFSGVAFAFATNNEAKEDIITEWPGAGSYTKQKVEWLFRAPALSHKLSANSRCQIPTVLYYDQYQKVVGWGPDIADALAPTGYPKPGVQKVEWFKLQLMLSGNTYIDPINLPPAARQVGDRRRRRLPVQAAPGHARCPAQDPGRGVQPRGAQHPLLPHGAGHLERRRQGRHACRRHPGRLPARRERQPSDARPASPRPPPFSAPRRVF